MFAHSFLIYTHKKVVVLYSVPSSFTAVRLHVCINVSGVNTDKLETISVMEGDSVALSTDVTKILRDDQILWRFGPKNARIAENYKQNPPLYDNNGRFKDRLKLNLQTGSLTITNMNIADSENYKLTIISRTGTSYKTFRVSVYGESINLNISCNHCHPKG